MLARAHPRRAVALRFVLGGVEDHRRRHDPPRRPHAQHDLFRGCVDSTVDRARARQRHPLRPQPRLAAPADRRQQGFEGRGGGGVGHGGTRMLAVRGTTTIFKLLSRGQDRYPGRCMSTLTFSSWFAAQQPKIPLAGAQAILALAEGGATVPFIARYRKEQTGNLDEVAIRHVLDAKERWDAIIKRQAFIVEEIARQGKLTPELEAQHPRDVRPDAARGHLSALTSRSGRRRPQSRARRGSSRSPTGCGTRRTATVDRRRGDAGGARGRVRRRGEGNRGRRRRAGGRGRHRGRAPVRGRGAAAAGARPRCSSEGFARDPKGREGQDAEPLRELLLVPGARARSC